MNAKQVMMSVFFVAAFAAGISAQCSSCVVNSNQFPVAANSGNDAYVILSEQTTCTFDSDFNLCLITGTVTFEPAASNCCSGVNWRASPTTGGGTSSTDSSYAVFSDTGSYSIDDSSSCSPNGSGQVVFTPASDYFACANAGIVAADIRSCVVGLPQTLSVNGVPLTAVKSYYCQ